MFGWRACGSDDTNLIEKLQANYIVKHVHFRRHKITIVHLDRLSHMSVYYYIGHLQ